VPSALWMGTVTITSSCTWSGQHHAQRGHKQQQHVLRGAKQQEQQQQQRGQQELRGAISSSTTLRGGRAGGGYFEPSVAAWVDCASRRLLVVVAAALLRRLEWVPRLSLLSSLWHSCAGLKVHGCCFGVSYCLCVALLLGCFCRDAEQAVPFVYGTLPAQRAYFRAGIWLPGCCIAFVGCEILCWAGQDGGFRDLPAM
jgi:hypothetical protein